MTKSQARSEIQQDAAIKGVLPLGEGNTLFFGFLLLIETKRMTKDHKAKAWTGRSNRMILRVEDKQIERHVLEKMGGIENHKENKCLIV